MCSAEKPTWANATSWGRGQPVLLAVCRNSYFYITYNSCGAKYKISMDYHTIKHKTVEGITHGAGQLRSLPHNPHCTKFPANFSVDKHDKEEKKIFLMKSLPLGSQDQHGAWTPPGVHLGYDSQHPEGVGFKYLGSRELHCGTLPNPPDSCFSTRGPVVNTVIWVR